MPWVTIETSLSLSQLGDNFGPELTHLLSNTLNKPKEVARIFLFLTVAIHSIQRILFVRVSSMQHVLINLMTDLRILRAGVNTQLMNVFITATNVLGNPDDNNVYSAKFTEFIRLKTGLPTEQIFFMFNPIQPWQVGMNGTILPST